MPEVELSCPDLYDRVRSIGLGPDDHEGPVKIPVYANYDFRDVRAVN